MQAHNVELVIFDCDGVLIDSEVLSMQAWQALLSSFDIALSKQYFIEHFLGKSMEHVQGKLKDDFALTLTTSMKNKFHGLLFDSFECHLQKTTGITSVLSALNSLGIPFCVATSSSPERTTKALTSTGLLSYFEDRIFTRALVNKGKPAPDLFLYAANALNIAPKNCLVIEDSQPGIAAAKAADMRYFHYTGGAHLQNCIVTSDNTINSWGEFYSRIPDIFDMRKIK